MSTVLTVELVTIAALVAFIVALLLAGGPLLAVSVWALLTLVAVIEWRDARRRAADYHRHGRDGLRHHIRPTRRRRAAVLARRARTLRLRTAAPSAVAATIPDVAQFVRPA